jgi:CelD/BcsL family acetyltransferase involved in cellulose biosynthesis
MKITVLPGGELSSEHVSQWVEIQRADPALDSPYFRPEFTQAVAAVRGDVFVAVMEEGNRVCGFFPFQRGRWGMGRPVGWPMSDLHGVVAARQAEWDAGELVRAAALPVWWFDHVPVAQSAFRAHCWSTKPSRYMDLSQGFEAYRAARRAAGSKEIPDIAARARRIERQVGPLRFQWQTDDPRVFTTLLEWKGRQYGRTGHTNVVAMAWVVDLLDRIRQDRGAGFCGVLSALYIGDALAAAHLGIRADGVMHRWMPAYDAQLARHGPGAVCLLEWVMAAAREGVRRVDMGSGAEPYKLQWTSGTFDVAEGAVECRPTWRAARRAWQCAQRCARMPVLGSPARLGARLTRHVRRRWLYR